MNATPPNRSLSGKNSNKNGSAPAMPRTTCEHVVANTVSDGQPFIKKAGTGCDMFMQHTSEAFMIVDSNWHITYLNKKAEHLLQRTTTELTGKIIWDVFTRAIDSTIHGALTTAMCNCQYTSCLDYCSSLNIWHEYHIYPSTGSLFVFARDITRWKLSEEKLLQTQMRLEQAQQIAHLGNWMIDMRLGRSTWSDEMYRIYGLIPGDHNISMKDWLKFIHPDDEKRIRELVEESMLTCRDIAFHHRIVRPDGTVCHIYSESKFELDSNGHPGVLYGISHDVTEAKLAEEALRKSKQLFKYATIASTDIIWELNFLEKEYLVHEGKEKLFGVTKKLNWQIGIDGNYIVEEDRNRVRESFRRARMDKTCTFWEDEYRLYAIDNSVIYITNHATFIRDERGKALRAIGAITDITERKKLEMALLEHQRNEQLKITATALEAQERERNAIGIELHDNVNQILVGTKLIMTMIKTDPEKNAHLAGLCLENIQHAIDENRKIAHELVSPNLHDQTLIQQLQNLSIDMLAPAGIKVSLLDEEFVEKRLNKDHKLAVYRIAQEQCTNIVKYANAEEVTIRLFTSEQDFSMTISDNGQGMLTGKTCSGIGLRNIMGRVSVFGGTATINSSPGKGFTLEIHFPI
ncbi:MAG TPA: PAS domain-containing protein [Chitinophagaceae bacterium]|jgi:PAS domain S-box-containing protein|nr:PAS domain-containing protein [Chitinophagaceae bacterium]